MSKNYLRTQLRRLGKVKQRKSSTPTLSPVHSSVCKYGSSYSLSSNSSGGSGHFEEALDCREGMSITGYVQKFVVAVSELKKAMQPESDCASEYRQMETIRHTLKDVIEVVVVCLEQNHGMQSTGIKNSVAELLSSLNSCDHESISWCVPCNSAVDVLVDTFTTSVQLFLGVDRYDVLDSQQTNSNYVDLSYMEQPQAHHESIVKELDFALTHMQDNVKFAAQYMRVQIKYHRDISTYLKRREEIELQYFQEMQKLTQKTCSIFTTHKQQHESLPLIDLLLQSLEQDMRIATDKNSTLQTQVGGMIVEPLQHKCTKNEKLIKELEDNWHKEQKKMNDAEAEMKSAQHKYYLTCQDLSRVRALLLGEPYGKQADKRKKELTDLELKEVIEMEFPVPHVDATEHPGCPLKFNTLHFVSGYVCRKVSTTLEKSSIAGKEDMKFCVMSFAGYEDDDGEIGVWQNVVDRGGLWQCKETEVAYKHAVAKCNSCQYQVHKSAQQSVLCAYRRLVLDFDESLKSKLETYFQLQCDFFFPIPDMIKTFLCKLHDYNVGEDFMQYIKRRPTIQKEPEDYLFEKFSAVEESSGELSVCQTNEASQGGVGTNSNSHSKECVDPKEISSEQREVFGVCASQEQEQRYSKSALTHIFQRMQCPSRCRECDTFVYFNGYECGKCGLACHERCLESLSIICGNKRLERRLNTFGMDILKHLEVSKTKIPIIVMNCIAAVEQKGLETHGLYRISTTKNRLEHLCHLFETGVGRVDLSSRDPHLIASCLKLYFQQLPEPVFTFDLYDDLLAFSNEASYFLPCKISSEQDERIQQALLHLEKLKEILSCLDHHRYLTLARLFIHLNRVCSSPYVEKNGMSAHNLGIVFGPTLLRGRGAASLALLADLTMQAKTIEIIISHVNEIFMMSEEEILRECCTPDEVYIGEERLIDGARDVEAQVKDIYDDDRSRTLNRSPLGTPPEVRREYICELQGALHSLHSISPQRMFLPEHSHVSQSESEDSISEMGTGGEISAMEHRCTPHYSSVAVNENKASSQNTMKLMAEEEENSESIVLKSNSYSSPVREISNQSLSPGISREKNQRKTSQKEKGTPAEVEGPHSLTQSPGRETYSSSSLHEESAQILSTQSAPVSPWHDTTRKKRINPLRVLKYHELSLEPSNTEGDGDEEEESMMLKPTDEAPSKSERPCI